MLDEDDGLDIITDALEFIFEDEPIVGIIVVIVVIAVVVGAIYFLR